MRQPCTATRAIGGRVGRYYDPTTGQFLSVDPLVDETGQPYAYTGDDPVNGIDPLGLSSELSAAGREQLAELFAALSATDPITGEAPTLGKDLSTLASENGTLQECRQLYANEQNVCDGNPGTSAVSRYLAQGGSACLLNQITSDEGSGHNQAAAIAALVALGAVVAAKGGGGDSYDLYHGTDTESARNIAANGIDRGAADQYGGDGKFYSTTDLPTAQVFASGNPAEGRPAVVGIKLSIGVNGAVQQGIIEPVKGFPGTYTVSDWDAFNGIATFDIVDVP